ncbi:uncharacterized protein [Drosophila pseudoobscura]|uniref:Uncharacterized protein n=1 Tax=Drosophila pseudoobscura pseudoobscura TaxID=46245 RepID=A0A6I8WAG7_DROPS|nr:uncharacterized protein LOC117184779 [Drosophila pseudoobscura]
MPNRSPKPIGRRQVAVDTTLLLHWRWEREKVDGHFLSAFLPLFPRTLHSSCSMMMMMMRGQVHFIYYRRASTEQTFTKFLLKGYPPPRHTSLYIHIQRSRFVRFWRGHSWSPETKLFARFVLDQTHSMQELLGQIASEGYGIEEFLLLSPKNEVQLCTTKYYRL